MFLYVLSMEIIFVHVSAVAPAEVNMRKSNIELLRHFDTIPNHTYRAETILEFWRNWLEQASPNLEESILKLLKDPVWWDYWTRLHPSTRENVISKVTPFLFAGNGISLDCSSAWQLCLADKNCASKYWIYQSSCFPYEASPDQWLHATGKNKFSYSMERIKRDAQFSQKRGARGSKGRQKLRRKHKRKNRKRMYHQNKKASNRSKRRRMAWKKATSSLHYWMGEYWPNIYDRKLLNDRAQCTPKCLNALLMLNNTVYAPLFAKCDCSAKQNFNNSEQAKRAAWNAKECKNQQAKALKCRPRLYKPRKATIGCTESRIKCEHDPKCSIAQSNFLKSCSQVINDVRCDEKCKDAIVTLSAASRHFNTCVCDGTEKRECTAIRAQVLKLCVPNNNTTRNDATIASKRTKKSISGFQNCGNCASLNTAIMILLLFFCLFHLFCTS